MYIETGWRITGVKFLLPFSLDSITVLKFATILPDTSRPPNMCYCGKCFDNNYEVAAYNSKAHKKDTHVDIRGGRDPYVTKPMMIKAKCGDVRTVHLKLFNKKCKYADCE